MLALSRELYTPRIIGPATFGVGRMPLMRGVKASGAQGEGFCGSAARAVGVRRGRSPYEDLSPTPVTSSYA